MDVERIKFVESNSKTFRWQVQGVHPYTGKIQNFYLPFANLINALDVATKTFIADLKYCPILIFDRVSRETFAVDHRGDMTFYRSY